MSAQPAQTTSQTPVPFAPVRSMQGIRRLRWEVTSRVKANPAFYMPFIGSRSRDLKGNFRGLNRQTELLIDAFPRSANTYATYGFLYCQANPVRVSHHLHAPAAMLFAAKHGIPALTIIRDPLNACASVLAYLPNYGIEQTFRDYISYYDAVSRSLPHVFVAKFETVTADLGKVIEAVNAKYDKSFTVFSNSPEDVEAVRAKTKEIITAKFGDAAYDQGRNSVQSEASMGIKNKLVAHIEALQPDLSVVQEAKALFAEVKKCAAI